MLFSAIVRCARGERQAGIAAIDEWVASAADHWVGVDSAYALCADKDKALDLLEHEVAHEGKYAGYDLEWIAYDPTLASLRSEPRFRAILRKLHLPE